MNDPQLPDVGALRRRVLLTGVVTLVLFVTASYVVHSLGAGQGWLLVAAVLVYVLVTRPLMRPVRDAVALRRRLAYQAFLDVRAQQRGQGGDTA